jgi:DDE family transposase
VPGYTTLYCFLRRLDGEVVTRVLRAAVSRLPPSAPDGMVVAVDATGFSPTAASRSFVDLIRNRGTERTRQHWPKWVVAVDVRRRVVLGQLAYAGPANASALLRPVVEMAWQTGGIALVLADAEFDSERNHHYIRDQLGTDSIIPAKRGKSTWQLQGIRAQMRANFPTARYRPRTLVESVFSAAKRKLSSRAPGRLSVTQHLQTLLLGLAYDIYRLRRALLLPLC